MRASMKKYILIFILTWSAVTLLPQITHGMWGFGEKSTAEGIKIGVVDINEIFDKYSKRVDLDQ
jgi:hypothetical protein